MVYSPSIFELLISNHAYNIMRVICMLVSNLRICSMLLQDSFKKKNITELIRPTYTHHPFYTLQSEFLF